MCWTGKITNFRIAFKDVPVIKVCYKSKDVKGYLSIIQDYLYDLDKTEKAKFGIRFLKTKDKRFFIIEAGLHSYEATKFWKGWDKYYNVCKDGTPILDLTNRFNCLIGFVPKGSIYFINKHGEIVSNKLKLVYNLATPIKKSGD